MNEFQDRRRARKQIYFLLMFIALAIVAGRIATVISREGDTAFLSANDRSRWCTITSLVELRTYEIDKLSNTRTTRIGGLGRRSIRSATAVPMASFIDTAASHRCSQQLSLIHI